jgi:hypothetical protein
MELVLRCADEIEDGHIRAFTKVALARAPKYIWTIMASTSGKYHHGELLSEHMLKAFHYGREHVRMLGWWWDPETVSVFYSALLLHDVYRCGFEGRESTYEDGKFRTDSLHPVYAAKELGFTYYNMPDVEEPYIAKNQKWYKKLAKAIAGHMGPWSPLAELSPMQDNALSLRLHVFLVDYVVSRHNIMTVVPELQEFGMTSLRRKYYPNVEETQR